MNQEDLINLLKEDFNTKDFSNLTKKINYEVRLEFFKGKKLINKFGNNIFFFWGARGFFEHLFTEDEALKLLEQYHDFKDRSIIFYSLSDEEKEKYIDIAIKNDGLELNDISSFSALDFILSLKNQDLIDKSMASFISLKQDLNYFDYQKIIEVVSPKARLEILDKMIEEHSKGNKNIISPFGLENIINMLPKENRKDIVSKILTLTDYSKVSNKKKRCGLIDYSIGPIIKSLPDTDRLELLKKIKKYTEETGISFSLKDLLIHIPLVDFKEALMLFVNEKDFSNSDLDIIYFANYNSDLKQYIDIYLQVQRETGKKLIDEATFARLLAFLEDGVQKKLFFYYVYQKKAFNFEKVIIFMDTPMKYRFLDQSINLFLEKGISIVANYPFVDKHVINRNEYASYPDGSVLYENINKVYIEKMKINADNFNKFIQRFGYCATKYLDNENILKALRMEEKDFIKYLDIFSHHHTELNHDDINTVCNALFQREFRLQQKEDYHIFSKLESLLNNKEKESKEELINILNSINQYINVNSYINSTLEEFIARLYKHSKEDINILHNITNNYIAKKRDIYAKKRLENINTELNLQKKISKQCYKRKYIEKFNFRDFRFDFEIGFDQKTLNED